MTDEPPSSPPRADLVIEAVWSDAELDLEALVETAVAAVAARVPAWLARADTELAVRFTDDSTIAALNAEWRGKAGATDVLSFPATEPDDAWPTAGTLLLGDVVLARETCERDATELARPLADHVTHLVVHGVLHLLHHDHRTEAAARAMESLEVAILGSLGIADPYRDRSLLEETR